MRIVIFTPAVNTSAIGRMASLVTRILVSQGHEISVVRTEKESYLGSLTHDFNTEVTSWNDCSRVSNLVGQADGIFYQIGDNYDFHWGALEWLPYSPGIVCLHDFFLGHLFWDWAQGHREQADATLLSWYGKEAVRCFFGYASNDEFLKEASALYPMTEWVCSMADGVVTHSNWGINRVLKSCAGPVYVVPLAYDAPKLIGRHDDLYGTDHHVFTVLTVGHINSNKRVASVIRAIGGSVLLRDRCVYRLVGHILPDVALELSALARQCQVNLLISGEVDDATLAHAIDQADVISCLRWPSLEAASASAVEALLYGKPTIVTDTGFYHELPDNCVKKIDPENEIGSIQSALEQLFCDPVARSTIGSDAKAWAESTFSPEIYATSLVAIAHSAQVAKPAMTALSHFSDILSRWGGGWNDEWSLANGLEIFSTTSRA